MVETGIGKKGCGNLGVFLKYIYNLAELGKSVRNLENSFNFSAEGPKKVKSLKIRIFI